MRLKRLTTAILALLFCAACFSCAPAAAPAEQTPAPEATNAPESVVFSLVTPAPTPTLSPSPTPSPEPTGRALRAWNLLQIQRAYLTEHPPADGDIEGALSYMKIDADKKIIALTFDDGPSNMNTNRILDVLEKYHARATFFVIGKRIQNHEAVVARAISLGCEIGSHTWGHSDFTKYPKSALIDSLEKTDAAMVANFDYHMKLFRPPYASINEDVEEGAAAMGYALILWSGSSHDWSIEDADKIYKNTMACVADGAIVLFHDLYPFTAEAIEHIVPELITQGYQLVTVSELMAMDEKPVAPGERYGGWAESVKVVY